MNASALPYADPATLPEVYADAGALAAAYPVTRLPNPEHVDPEATAQQWHRLADEITAEVDQQSWNVDPP